MGKADVRGLRRPSRTQRRGSIALDDEHVEAADQRPHHARDLVGMVQRTSRCLTVEPKRGETAKAEAIRIERMLSGED